MTVTETTTPAITETATSSVTETITPTSTVTPPDTATVTETITEIITQTMAETITPTITETVTSTITDTVTQTVTETVTPALTDTVTFTPEMTVTQTQTPEATATVSPTQEYTNTPTRTIIPTVTATPSVTPTPTPRGENTVRITIYDINGEAVRELAVSYSSVIVQNFIFSVSPFRANGINRLYMRNTSGEIIGDWDGKDKYGIMSATGRYLVVVRTTDKNGNEFISEKHIDLVAESSASIVNTAIFMKPGSIEFEADAVNAEWVRVKIYNIGGEIIKNVPSVLSPRLKAVWDKKSASGRSVSNGIYIIVIEYKDANSGIISRKFEKVAVK